MTMIVADVMAWLTPALMAWCCVEAVFVMVFFRYLLPWANVRQAPAPYRDFPQTQDRRRLLLRILDRILWLSQARHKVKVVEGEPIPDPVKDDLERFVLHWFEPLQKDFLRPRRSWKVLKERPVRVSIGEALSKEPLLRSSSLATTPTATTVSTFESPNNSWASEDESFLDHLAEELVTVDDVGRDDVYEFFSWVFFGLHAEDVDDEQHDEIEACIEIVHQHLGLVFSPGKAGVYQPRRMTLEDGNAWYRPLLVYVGVYVLKLCTALVLWACGFARVVSPSTGLVGWHRAARKGCEQKDPLLFFHGIAPGGLFVYLPMLLLGLLRDGRACCLVENPAISGEITTEQHAEAETVQGVYELVRDCMGTDRSVILSGHSFGSCPMTWLLRDGRLNVRHMLLLDPVTLLLSEPDVLSNFLYSSTLDKIKLAASSELFTERYLRRRFSWYNSELWLDDVPATTNVLVVLSGQDEIVPAPKVRELVQAYNRPHVQQWYHDDAKHIACVISPSLWNKLHTHIRDL